MKRLCWILFATSAAIAWMLALVFFVSTDLQMLDLAEQLQLKEGKQFWVWESPQGPFAMHYVEKGKGDNHILLLHGFRAHTFTWRFLIDPLAHAGYHVWAVDLVGYGLSDKPEHVAYNIDFFLAQVKAFMEAKGISQTHLVGNSMGGGLALKLALSYPLQVSSLSLINALGYPQDLPYYVLICRHINQLWTPFLGPRMVRHTLSHIVYDKENISDDQVEAYALPYRLPGGISATLLTLQQYDNKHLFEMAQQYSQLHQPMLVVWGEHDQLLPFSHYESFNRDFPRATKLLIPQCGHIPQEEAPQLVVPALLDFLQNHPFAE